MWGAYQRLDIINDDDKQTKISLSSSENAPLILSVTILSFSFLLCPQSMDERGNRNNVTHTFFVNVNDAPDNKPFWTTIVPFYELDECQDKVR